MLPSVGVRRGGEADGLVAFEEGPAVDMGVGHSNEVLLDDRAFIEIGRYGIETLTPWR